MMEQVLAVNGKPLGDRPLAQLMLPGQPSYELVVRRDELDRGLEAALCPVGLWEDSAQSARPLAPRAQAAPAQCRAPPQQLGSSAWP